ncbi:MAG TPA: ROK family protein [Chloroflexota bacterium]|nr:ROK family protein [Chloroflexota bacterium]
MTERARTVDALAGDAWGEASGQLGGTAVSAALAREPRVQLLGLLRRLGALTRADLAGRLGVSTAMVGEWIADLAQAGLVEDAGKGASRGGRPPQRVALAGDAAHAVGLDLSGWPVRAVVGDLNGSLRFETLLTADDLAGAVPGGADRADRDPPAPAGSSADAGNGETPPPFPPVTVPAVARLADTAIARSGLGRAQVLAVGLALAGFVNTRSGTHRADPAPGSPSVPLAAGVAQRLRLPVQIEDMARAAALAEARRGAAAGVADVLFLFLGDRVGAALILDGNLYHAATGVVGEIGHVVVREDGPRCTCGNLGCVQALASRPAILRQVEDGLAGGVVSTIRAPSTVDRPLDLPEVVEAAAQGDRLAISVLRQAGQDIGRALAAGTNLLGPTMVVLGGQAPHLGEVFVDEVRRVLASHVVSPIWERLRVATSQLGPSAAALGAAWGALDQLIDSGAVVRHAGRHRLRKRDRLAAAR